MTSDTARRTTGLRARELALLLVCLSAVWPLVEIARADVALPVLITATAVWACGTGLRAVRRSAAFIVLAQIVLLPLAFGVTLLARGIEATPAGVRAAMSAGFDAANESVAPLPAVPGVIALLAVGAGLVSLVVDFVGGTSRLPALTVLPLAAPFVLATTALGETLPARYFCAAAVSWALLMWLSDHARPANGRLVAPFAVVTIAAVAAALVIAERVPHRATPALADGAARGVDTSVDFTESLDLSKNLTSRNSAPVLTYTSDDPAPGPLRVTTSSSYRDGRWIPAQNPPTSPLKANAPFPDLGYDESVPSVTYKTSVTLNGMRAPLVAVPAPARAANFGTTNPAFKIVTTSGVPRLSAQSPAYAVLHRSFTAAARPTSDEKVGVGSSVTADDLSTSLPEAATTRLRDVVQASGAASAETRFDAAVALQNHLRDTSTFTYSLSLAPTRTVDGVALDPLANFLETKRGYCTQYATSMVMGARSLGIPARIAIGFLPGSERNNEYTVRAADAHAWAELYFPGMGWTRFDPTPGSRSGAAPVYAGQQARPSASSSRATARSTSAAARPSTQAPTTRTTTSTSSTRPASSPHEKGTDWTRVLTVLAAVLIVAAAACVVPMLGWRRRNALLRSATNDREADEGHWHRMVWNLRDLGYSLDTTRSPRDTVVRFSDDNPRAPASVRDALSRAAAGIEGSRYAPHTGRSIASSTARVTRAARSEAPFGARLRAWLIPLSGRTGARD